MTVIAGDGKSSGGKTRDTHIQHNTAGMLTFVEVATSGS